MGEREVSPEYHDFRRISARLRKEKMHSQIWGWKFLNETRLEMTQVMGLTRRSFTLEDMSDILWLLRKKKWNLVQVIVRVCSGYPGLQPGRPDPTQTSGHQTRSKPGSTQKPEGQLRWLDRSFIGLPADNTLYTLERMHSRNQWRRVYDAIHRAWPIFLFSLLFSPATPSLLFTYLPYCGINISPC